LDLKMPGINGYEVLKYIKQLHRSIKVLILSGSPLRKEYSKTEDQLFPDRLDYEKLVENLADGFINKPFDVEAVLTKIKELAGKKTP